MLVCMITTPVGICFITGAYYFSTSSWGGNNTDPVVVDAIRASSTTQGLERSGTRLVQESTPTCPKIEFQTARGTKLNRYTLSGLYQKIFP